MCSLIHWIDKGACYDRPGLNVVFVNAEATQRTDCLQVVGRGWRYAPPSDPNAAELTMRGSKFEILKYDKGTRGLID